MIPTGSGSSALETWSTVGQERLGQLLAMHAKATGAKPGRRWETTQFNRMLMVALVGQFQAFCRELHDCGVNVHVAAATKSQQQVLRVLLTQGRKFDASNPRAGALGSDFGRFGFKLVEAIKASDTSAEQDLKDLESLIDYRNAVAHGNESSLASIEAGGRVRGTKHHFVQNRKTLDRLASTMDSVVGSQLSQLLDVAAPW